MTVKHGVLLLGPNLEYGPMTKSAETDAKGDEKILS